MPVMITNSCGSRGSAGRIARFFATRRFPEAREAALFFVAMMWDFPCAETIRVQGLRQPGRPVSSRASVGLVNSAMPATNGPQLLLVFDCGQQVVIQGEEGQFEPVPYAELVEDVGEVPLDRFFADAEGLGDVLVGAAFRDQRHHFQFA